jgi:hypothetical protein
VGLELVVEGDFTEADGRATVRRLLAEGWEFDAVFAHNDLAAVGALGALRDAGIRVPEEIAVIGFDDIPVARHTEPSLSTVRQPMRELGETAARLLLARLAGQEPPTTPRRPAHARDRARVDAGALGPAFGIRSLQETAPDGRRSTSTSPRDHPHISTEPAPPTSLRRAACHPVPTAR